LRKVLFLLFLMAFLAFAYRWPSQTAYPLENQTDCFNDLIYLSDTLYFERGDLYLMLHEQTICKSYVKQSRLLSAWSIVEIWSFQVLQDFYG
jgi:hypothetical protein